METDINAGGFGSAPVVGQSSGESIPGAAAAQGEAGQNAPEYITKADLAVLQEKMERRLQSLSDRQSDRLQKEVQGKIAQLENRYTRLGMEIPADVRQQVINDTVLSYSEDEDQAGPAQGPSPELRSYVMKQASKILQAAGVPAITSQDPEYKLLDLRTSDPDDYLESVKTAAAAYAERAKKAPTNGNQSPAARVPIVGGAQAGGDLMNEYQRAMQGVRAGTERALQIRRSFRQRGLNI